MGAPLHAVLLGAGAATSLGRLVGAAAAARAGVTRFAPVPGLVVLDDESGELVPIVGAAAHPLTEHFEGWGRVARLLVDALADLIDQAGATIAWPGTGIYIALSAPPPPPPPPPDPEPAEELVPDEYGVPEPDVEETPPAPSVEERARAILGIALAEQGIDLARVRKLHLDERIGAVQALRDAMEALERKEIAQAIVIAADSLIDEVKLAHFARQPHRLKTAADPVGFLPGEAAVAVLLGASGTSRGCTIHSAVVEGHAADDAGNAGRALANVLVAAAATLPTRPETLYLDLNGEDGRAVEWGQALARLPAGSPLRNCTARLPATAFGETGAAGPLLATALAARASARGYDSAASCLVAVAHPSGARAAFGIEAGRD